LSRSRLARKSPIGFSITSAVAAFDLKSLILSEKDQNAMSQIEYLD